MSTQLTKTKELKEYRAKADQDGFTLMELLVASSIFVIFTLAVLGVHGTIIKNSQKTLAYNRIQAEAQVIMESLAKKIRTSRVDYSHYGDIGEPGARNELISNPETELALVDLTGASYVFALSGGAITVSADGGSPNAIPAENVNVKDIKFYINPTSYPFDINFPPESQPRVTMVVTFSASQGAQSASLTIQQTIPQRSGGIVE